MYSRCALLVNFWGGTRPTGIHRFVCRRFYEQATASRSREISRELRNCTPLYVKLFRWRENVSTWFTRPVLPNLPSRHAFAIVSNSTPFFTFYSHIIYRKIVENIFIEISTYLSGETRDNSEIYFPRNRTLSLCGDVYFLVTGGRVNATCQSPCIDTEKSKRGRGAPPFIGQDHLIIGRRAIENSWAPSPSPAATLLRGLRRAPRAIGLRGSRMYL